jgi:uncharacterized membrane-anchored protein
MLLGRSSLPCLLLIVCSLALTAPAHTAYADLDQEEEDPDAPLPWQIGPKHILLGHHIELALPSGYQFLGLPHAETVMTQLGNLYNDNLLGIVISSEQAAEPIEDDGFMITLRYDAEGYVRDEETLDGQAILQAFHEAESTYNEDRKKAGFPAIHAEGWQEPPRYDKARHELLWGLLISSPDDEAGADHTVNYNTRVLGRKGYVSINLVTDARLLPRYKPAAAAILEATTFTQGMRYEDFDSTTDSVAEYGLTGLVLGGIGLGVAKLAKIGLLAKFGKLLLAGLIAGKKVIAMFFVVVAAGLRKFWNRRKDRVSQA